MSHVILPTAEQSLETLTLRPAATLETSSSAPSSRRVFAASHVVADPLRAAQSRPDGHIDWDATLAIRHHAWELGLGIAESMDTAQRGMGLSAADAMELARRTMVDDPGKGDGVVVGIATDALTDPEPTLDQIISAYLDQLEVVEMGGGTPVIMASRHLARVARSPDDYLTVYDTVIGRAGRPVILHWLGDVFDPELRGYWGTDDTEAALGTVVDVISVHSPRIAGIKISLLEPRWEVRLRERVPDGVAVFTGDDFNYVDMIVGDGDRHSHALLGAFAPLGAFASAAFSRLDQGDIEGFRSILGPTQKLSRLVFESPTRFYKTGIVWLAYLAGLQSHFRMLAGLESGRDLLHLADLVREADAIGLFPDVELTASRVNAYFRGQGIA